MNKKLQLIFLLKTYVFQMVSITLYTLLESTSEAQYYLLCDVFGFLRYALFEIIQYG